MFQTKVVEKNKTYILFSITSSKIRAVYEITWENMVESDRPQMTVQYGVLYKKKATDTHSEICNLLISKEIMVTRTPLNVVLYLHVLSF
jgi:hypothetical protein